MQCCCCRWCGIAPIEPTVELIQPIREGGVHISRRHCLPVVVDGLQAVPHTAWELLLDGKLDWSLHLKSHFALRSYLARLNAVIAGSVCVVSRR